MPALCSPAAQSGCSRLLGAGCHSVSWPPPLPVPQLSVQYRVAEEGAYAAFYSLEDPVGQVTSYGE